MQIRRLEPADAPAYRTLRLQALCDSPASFSASHEEECDIGLDALADLLAAAADRAVFGAFATAEAGAGLAGMVGIGRDARRKKRHKAYLWGMYVAPALRGRGAAKWLVREALDFARSIEGVRQVTLAVTAGNAAALALYESLGFNAFGVEADALLVDGVLLDDIHMVRLL